MNKNVLKSQNIGEGMISVHNGQNLCWSHREMGAIAIFSDKQLALFCEIRTLQAFHYFYCLVWYVTIVEHFLYL